jgi:D-threo-aldose 1-dehydrogenase
MQPRPLGSTGLAVTPLGVGTSALASIPADYGYQVGEERAIATVEAVLASPLNFLDTSNGYGEDGAAERRIGAAIRRAGGLPPGFVLATKVDPDPGSGDFSGARVSTSLAESLERLGIERVPLLHLHDPERISWAQGTAPDGPLQALIELREQRVVDHIGLAAGDVDLMLRYLETGVFDVVLNHNRYTLLDRSAVPLFAAARKRGIGVINAAPYGSGMLAKGPAGHARYAYRENAAMARRAAAMQAACDARGVPLAAAALQFSLRSDLVDATIVGVSAPERVPQTLELAEVEIPDALWEELEAL